MAKFRTGRIWRLGEKELTARKYFAPAELELHDAREDEEPTAFARERYRLGITAKQLTSLAWHEHWGRP